MPLEQKPTQPSLDVPVELDEARRRVTRPKVLSPPAHHRIDLRDHRAEIVVAATAGCQVSDARSHLTHSALRRPPLQEVDALPRPLPDRPAQPLAQVTPQKVEALASPREIDGPGLLRM